MTPKLKLPSFPDVLKTPSPAGPVPIPYPNLGAARQPDKKGIEQLFEDAFSAVTVHAESVSKTLDAIGRGPILPFGRPGDAAQKLAAHEATHTIQQVPRKA